MRLVSQILNAAADDFYTSGIFRPRLTSLVFWVITFTGVAAGLEHGRHVGTGIGLFLWAGVGACAGLVGGALFILISFVLFRLLLRRGWIVPPEQRHERNR
jgi:hypothetical protein